MDSIGTMYVLYEEVKDYSVNLLKICCYYQFQASCNFQATTSSIQNSINI